MPKKKKKSRKRSKSSASNRRSTPNFEIPQVAIELWREAYDLADEIREIEPWRNLLDTDPLAFTNPQTGEPSFITLLGHAGQHFAVVVYPDVEAMNQLVEFSLNPKTGIELALIPQLHLDFVDREYVERPELRVLKALNRTYRGSRAWPQFRTFRPAFVPWHMETDELQLLIHALKLVRDRVPDLGDEYVEGYLGDAFAIESKALFIDADLPKMREVAVPEPELEPIAMPEPRLVGEMELFQPVDQEIELMLSILPQQIDDYIRPYYAIGLFAVVSGEGFVVGFELISPIPDHDAVYESIPSKFVEILEPHGVIPSAVKVNDERVENQLAGLAKAVGFKLELVDELPDAEDFVQSMSSMGM